MITKTTPLKEVLELAAPCQCSSCSHGCKFGSGALAGEDSNNISKFLKISEEELKNNFLEEKELFNKKILKPRLSALNFLCLYIYIVRSLYPFLSIKRSSYVHKQY